MKNISIIMPCYNAGKYLAGAIDSVLNQGIPVQLVVVDDGSSDDSLAVLNTYRDRIHLIRGDHAGVAAARNSALSSLEGQYTLLLDADDALRAGALGFLLAAVKGDRQVAYGRFCSWDADMATMLGVHSPGRMKPDPFRFLCRRNLAPPGTLIFPTSAFAEVGGFDQQVAGCEDWDFLIRLARAGYSFRGINRIVFDYRRRSESASNQALGMYRAGAEVIRRCHAPDERLRTDCYPGGNNVDSLEDNLFAYRASCFALAVLDGNESASRKIIESIEPASRNDWRLFGNSFRQGLRWHSLSKPDRKTDALTSAQTRAAEIIRSQNWGRELEKNVIHELLFPDFRELLLRPGPFKAGRLAGEWLVGRRAKRDDARNNKCS